MYNLNRIMYNPTSLEYPTMPPAGSSKVLRAPARSDVRQKPKSTTQKPVSTLATRHFQKFRTLSGGNDGFKKNRKPEIFKIVLNFGTHARKLFQIIQFRNQMDSPPMSDPTKVGTHKHIAIALRRKTFIFIGHQSTATVQAVHCPLHFFSASASKHTGLDSLPHHIDRSVQIEL